MKLLHGRDLERAIESMVGTVQLVALPNDAGYHPWFVASYKVVNDCVVINIIDDVTQESRQMSSMNITINPKNLLAYRIQEGGDVTKSDFYTMTDLKDLPINTSVRVKFPDAKYYYNWTIIEHSESGIVIESEGILRNSDFVPNDRVGPISSMYQFERKSVSK